MKFALDRSVRTYDSDGRLRVAVANISKANICPYYGREVPGWQELGLDPDKVYNLYRDPDELIRAAPTANNIQIMIRHVPVSADDPVKEDTIGATGTDAAFNEPYLQNSLAFWDKAAIDLIEADEMRELSCGYRYTPDMTPGFSFGLPYDGVMRDIEFNHVALVREGRAGPDVIVGDEKPEPAHMALKARKSPKLQKLVAALDGKLAADASTDDLEATMDEMEDNEEAEAEAKKKAEEGAEDEDADEKDKNKAMDAATVKKMIDSAVKAATAGLKPQAMDEAVKVAAKQIAEQTKAISDAKTAVQPFVGNINGAYDSADDIYALALDAAKIDHTGVTGVGLARMVAMLRQPTASGTTAAIASDAALMGGADPFAEFKAA